MVKAVKQQTEEISNRDWQDIFDALKGSAYAYVAKRLHNAGGSAIPMDVLFTSNNAESGLTCFNEYLRRADTPFILTRAAPWVRGEIRETRLLTIKRIKRKNKKKKTS